MGGFSFAPQTSNGSDLSKSITQGTNASGCQAGKLADMSSGLLNPASQYWMSLLSGNPAQTTAALAPDINRIRGSEASVMNSASTLAPRGGGRGTTLFNAPLQAETQTQGTFNAARPAAASAAGSLGVQTGGLSLQSLAQALQAMLAERGQTTQMALGGPMNAMLSSLAKVPAQTANTILGNSGGGAGAGAGG